MTQIGSAFLFVAFFLLYQGTGSDSFVAFTYLAHTLSPHVQNAIFFCALIGFLLKAGIMPLHIWLPRAHPAAPSPVSALMSGVMIKTALYGLILVSMSWLRGAEIGWGLVLALLGSMSAVLGARLSTQDNGLKRILAYSSIDNMGLIVLCTGVSLMAQAQGETILSDMAMTAALLQAWNHCLFKSTLFQGAGAVMYAAHTDNLNRLGGLLRRLPWTGLFFLVALLSLMAMPPWGGFTSEWILFMTLLHTASAGWRTWVGLISVTSLLALILTGAFAVLSALRIFGIGFLAEPRSEQAARALEVPFSMRVSLGAGAFLTLLSGLFPGWMVTQAGQALRGILPLSPARPGVTAYAVPGHALLWLGTASAGGVLAAWLIPRMAAGAPRVTVTPTWTCGGPRVPAMSCTASGLSQPVGRAWQFLSVPLAIGYLYRPVWGMVLQTATLFRQIQNGHVRTYLVCLFATVLLLMIIVR
jgi:hydrogenase-4 component B